MVRIDRKNTLRNLRVNDAMRRQVIQINQAKNLDYGINALIKYKVGALLIIDSLNQSIGVVSKTDIMGAYYAGLPIDSSLDIIMISPPLFCRSGDSLETALEQMRTRGVYRLYVNDDKSGELAGALAYPDIVGVLYRYCHQCEYSHLNTLENSAADTPVRRFTVREVMTTRVQRVGMYEQLTTVMEQLSAYRFGAILVSDEEGLPCGVISKTDLALNYKHGVDPGTEARVVMSAPVHTCDVNLLLEEAINKMIIDDIHRLFIHEGETSNIVGVLSLSDAARVRSGSCCACVSSRIKVEEYEV